jgi:hypothetical protein
MEPWCTCIDKYIHCTHITLLILWSFIYVMMTSKLYCSYYLSKTFVNLHLHYMYICTWTYLHTFWHVHIHVYKRHDCIILCFEFLYNSTHTLLNDNYMTAIDQVLEITVIVKTKGSIKLYVYSVYICLYMYIMFYI